MDAVETIQYKNRDIEIHYDDNAESPREWDNITEFHCSHSRYNLGDRGFNYRTGQECIDVANEAKKKGDVVLPLYLYDHSGITISLSPFSCPWDSGQVGFVIVRKQTMLENFGGKIFTQKMKEKALKLAQGEVKDYDQYLRGEIYGYIIDDHKDSCWGYFSIEDAIEEAKICIDWDEKKALENHCNQVKKWIKNQVPIIHRHAFCR